MSDRVVPVLLIIAAGQLFISKSRADDDLPGIVFVADDIFPSPPISGSLFQLLPSRPHMAHGGAEFLVFSFHERERGTVRIDVQTEVPPSLVPPDEYSTKRLLF